MAQPILYEKVVLFAPDATYPSTLSLFESRPELTRGTKKLELVGWMIAPFSASRRKPDTGIYFFPIELFHSMHALESLRIDEERIDANLTALTDTLRSSCPLLTELTLNFDHDEAASSLALPGIKRFTWSSYGRQPP